jgi:hypothetical protein
MDDPRGDGPRADEHGRPDEHGGAEALGIDEVVEDPLEADREAGGGEPDPGERHWADLDDEPGTTAMP